MASYLAAVLLVQLLASGAAMRTKVDITETDEVEEGKVGCEVHADKYSCKDNTCPTNTGMFRCSAGGMFHGPRCKCVSGCWNGQTCAADSSAQFPPPFNSQIDAAALFEVNHREGYLFSGGNVMSYSWWPHQTGSRTTGRPTPMSQHPIFNQLPPPFNAGVNAAVCFEYAHRQLYLFRQGAVMAYSAWTHQSGSRVIEAPVPTASHPVFNQLPAPFNSQIDAAVMFEKNHRGLYLFSGGYVMQYSAWTHEKGSRVQEGPVATASHPIFNQLPAPFNSHIDAAVMIEKNHRGLYMFSGGYVIQYSAWTHEKGSRVTEGPMPIAQHPIFSQLPPPFSSKIDAGTVFSEPHRDMYLYSQGQIISFSAWTHAKGSRVLAGPAMFGNSGYIA